MEGEKQNNSGKSGIPENDLASYATNPYQWM